MSSTPLVAWSFAFPSGIATRPSATIGLCQWTTPIGSVGDLAGRSSARRRGWRRALRRRAAPPATHRDRAAVAVRPRRMQAAALEAAAPPCPRSSRRRPTCPFQTAGSREDDRSARAPGPSAARRRSSAFTPGSAMQLQQPQHAVLAALHGVAARRAAPALVEPRSTSLRVQLRLVRRRPVREQPRRVGRQDEHAVAPVGATVERARCRSRRRGRRCRDRPRRRSATRSPSRSRSQVDGLDDLVPVGAERVPDVRRSRPVRRIERDDVALVRRRVADVAVGRREHEAAREVQRRRRASRASGRA